jgi:hypothetical protein
LRLAHFIVRENLRLSRRRREITKVIADLRKEKCREQTQRQADLKIEDESIFPGASSVESAVCRFRSIPTRQILSFNDQKGGFFKIMYQNRKCLRDQKAADA